MKTLELYQTLICLGQIISIDSNTFGVGLSINQLNDIKQQFDQVNGVKTKAAISKGIYQNKYHNFSEKFSLEDRLLLVRLYNRYTEENCMTFKTFARKFKMWQMEFLLFRTKQIKNSRGRCARQIYKIWMSFVQIFFISKNVFAKSFVKC